MPVHYFETKDNLIVAVVQRLVRLSINSIHEQEQRSHSKGMGLIEEYYVGQVKSLRRPQVSTRALYALFVAGMFNPQIGTLMQSYESSMQTIFLQRLQDAADLGQIRKDLDLPTVTRTFQAFRRGTVLLTLTDPTYDIKVLSGHAADAPTLSANPEEICR